MSNGIVKCKFYGRYGNQLFTYFIARIFAEKNKLNLISRIDNKIFIIKENINYGINPKNLTTIIRDNNSRNNLLSYEGKANYIFNGHFQWESYFYFHKNMILNWINPVIDIDRNKKIIIHIRLDDFLNDYQNLVINVDYYIYCVKKYCQNYKEITILCDKIRKKWEQDYIKELIQKLKELNKNVIYRNNNIHKDMADIINSDTLICSNSTFCFWGMFFSDSKKIIKFPYTGYSITKKSKLEIGFTTPELFKFEDEFNIVEKEFSGDIKKYFMRKYY